MSGTKESHVRLEFKGDARTFSEIIVFLGFYSPRLFLAHFGLLR